MSTGRFYPRTGQKKFHCLWFTSHIAARGFLHYPTVYAYFSNRMGFSKPHYLYYNRMPILSIKKLNILIAIFCLLETYKIPLTIMGIIKIEIYDINHEMNTLCPFKKKSFNFNLLTPFIVTMVFILLIITYSNRGRTLKFASTPIGYIIPFLSITYLTLITDTLSKYALSSYDPTPTLPPLNCLSYTEMT